MEGFSRTVTIQLEKIDSGRCSITDWVRICGNGRTLDLYPVFKDFVSINNIFNW